MDSSFMKALTKISAFIVLFIVCITGCELVMKPTVATASFELAAAPADIITVVLVVTHPDKKTRQTFNLDPEKQIFEEEFEEGTGYLFEMIAVSLTGVYTSSTTVDMVGGQTQIVDLFMDYEAFPLVSIDVTPDSASVAAGRSEQFKATGTYSNKRTADITSSVKWSISDAKLARIDGNGLATTEQKGEVTVRASSRSGDAKDSEISGEAKLIITVPVLTDIKVSPEKTSIAKGRTQQFTAEGRYSDGSSADITDTVEWSSKDTDVATINSSGLATGAGVGTAKISATLDDIVETAQIDVSAAVLTAISVTPESFSLSPEATKQFTATGTYSDSSTANITTSVSWSSNNTGVATINSGGLATAIDEGTATIKAVSGSLSDTAQLGVAVSGSQTFNKTGAVQTFTVPGGVELLEFELWGAQGGSTVDKWNDTVAGGKGGFATGKYQVTPGSTVYVYVGGFDGFNGGGAAGTNSGCSQAHGGIGGGASDIRIGGTGLSNRKIVAAGGGGAGGNRFQGCGRWAGGGGGAGYYGGGGGSGWDYTKNKPPKGGTQSTGGAGGETNGTNYGSTNGANGSSGQGGAGGNEVGSNQHGSNIAGAGGAGGGLTGSDGVSPSCSLSPPSQSCGGSQGSWAGQSGAGGSSYIGLVTNGTTTAGQKSGDGKIIIKW